MRPGENPLDLNNLPEDYGRDGKQIMEESSTNIQAEGSDTTRCRKKKSSGKDECGKVYECRFCSLKFCKSQALGGHMNRHRQERETETLNRARQLVFSNDNNLAAQGGPHLGLRDINMGGVPQGSFHQGSNVLDPYRPPYPTRLFPTSSPPILQPMQTPPPPPPPQGYLYTPSSRLMSFPSSHYPSHTMNEYYVSHVLPPNTHRQQYQRGPESSGYTCIGAPLGRDYQPQDGSGSASGEEGLVQNQEDVHNWGRGSGSGTTQCYDHSSINRFHDGL